MGLELLEGLLAGAIFIVVFLVLIMIAWLVFYLIGMYKFFEKAGQEGWKGLIPFYNTYVMAVDMAGLKWYWFAISIGGSLLSTIPVIGVLFMLVGVFANVNIYYNLSKKLNKTTGWIVLTALFGSITLPLLGYMNNTTWNQSAAVDPDGLLTSMLNANNNQQANPNNTQNQESNNSQTVDNQTQNTNNQ